MMLELQKLKGDEVEMEDEREIEERQMVREKGTEHDANLWFNSSVVFRKTNITTSFIHRLFTLRVLDSEGWPYSKCLLLSVCGWEWFHFFWARRGFFFLWCYRYWQYLYLWTFGWWWVFILFLLLSGVLVCRWVRIWTVGFLIFLLRTTAFFPSLWFLGVIIFIVIWCCVLWWRWGVDFRVIVCRVVVFDFIFVVVGWWGCVWLLGWRRISVLFFIWVILFLRRFVFTWWVVIGF